MPVTNPMARVPMGAFIKASGRSWWQARTAGGKIYSEWDTVLSFIGAATERLPLQLHEVGPRSQWEHLDKSKIVGLRLLCPNGETGELEQTRGNALFQLKVGVWGGGGDTRSHAWGHLIGGLENDLGDCLCYAWEPGRARLVHFRDNVLHFAYRQLGPLGLDALDLKL